MTTSRQPDERFTANLIVFIRRAGDEGRAKLWRVQIGQRTDTKRRPVAHISIAIGRQNDQSGDRVQIIVGREPTHDRQPNFGIGIGDMPQQMRDGARIVAKAETSCGMRCDCPIRIVEELEQDAH